MYAKHPEGAETGDMGRAQRFAKTVLASDWVPTVVNPVTTPDSMDRGKFYFHIGVWVIALSLNCTMNFWSKSAMEDKTGALTDSCTSDCYLGMSDTAYVIAILSAVSTIIGVVALLAGAAWFTADEYRSKAWLNTIITFLTAFGMVTAYYTFMAAAKQTGQLFFWVSLIAVSFQTYAQVLLYCTSATLNVLMLPRAFLPSIGASVQFVSALAISSGDFKSNALITQVNSTSVAYAEFTTAQKTVAWLVPGFTLFSLVLMIFMRRSTRVIEAGKGVQDISNFPFMRSFVLTPFLAAGFLSVYKLSFMTVDNNDPSAYVFALIGTMFNFVIISVVFVPGGDAFGIDAEPFYEGTYAITRSVAS